jgi:phenylpropionate dioxygenase-like ring-hydroxylating dioxygenase large terminal subunit
MFVSRWHAHWTRAMENMLDMPHLPFVHRTTIGVTLAGRVRPGSEMQVNYEPTADGGLIRATLDGQADDGWLEFIKPNRMTLHIPVPRRRLILHVFCVPEDEGRTRMIILSARDFARWLPIGPLLNWFNARVALQDQSVVETSLPAEVPLASLERSVASDKPTLAFRKYYLDVLRSPRASARAPTADATPVDVSAAPPPEHEVGAAE